MADPVIDFQPEEQQFDFQPAGATAAPVDSAKLPPEVLRAISSVPYHPPQMAFSPVAAIPDMPGEAPYSMKRAITEGMTDVLTAPTSGAETGIAPIGPEVSGGVEDVQTPGRRGKGALRLAAAGLDAATPFVGPAIFESPLNVARGFGEGYLAGKGARYVAKKSGADPETQDLAESVGQLGPLVGESVLRPRFGVASTPEATTASAGVRGAGAGVAVTPEAVTVRGKVGPLEGSKTFARKAKPAEAPTLTPQTIEGELAKNPATRDEIADAQVATNYAGPEQAKAAVVAKRQAQASAVPPGGAEKPAGAEKTPAATPTQTVRVQSENDNNKISSRENVGSQPTEQIPSGEPEVSDHAAQRSAIKAGNLGDAGAERVVHLGEGTPENPGRASGIIGKPTAKPRTNGEPLEHGFDFRPAEDVGTAVREATQKTNGALPRDERRKVERTPEEQQTQTLFKQARTELGEDASSDQVMARVDELKKAPVDFQADLYKHRSTQVNIPKDSEAHSALETARQRIADGDLAGDGKDIGGNHVTVRWGLTAPDDDKLEKLKSYISSLTPFEATLGKTEKFKPSESSDGAAVIQSPIEAPELGKINSELAKHAPFTEPTFKSYTPHATIAYVKPEKADRYVGMSVTHGKTFQVKSIAISDRQGNHEEVQLKGKPGTKYVLPSFVTHGLTKGAAPEKLTNEEMNKAYSRQKTALTKAENLPDHQARKFAVLKAATHAVNEWEDKFDGKWPDNWSRWQRAVDDAYHKFNHALGTSDQPPRLEDLVGKDVDSEVMKAALGGTTKKQPATSPARSPAKYEVAMPSDARDGVHVIDTSGPSTKTVATGFKSKAEAQDWIDTRQQEEGATKTPELFHALGQEAFAAGKKRVPGHDSKLLPFLKGADAATTNRALRQWLQGWDKANLAAPVPATSPATKATEPFSLSAPPDDIGIQQYIDTIPRHQQEYARAFIRAVQEKGKATAYEEADPRAFGIPESEMGEIEKLDDELVRRTGESPNEQFSPQTAARDVDAYTAKKKFRDSPAGKLDETLAHSLRQEAWEPLVEKGATDEQIGAMIGHVWGIEGGSTGPGSASYAYKGGGNPAFYYGELSARGKPTLAGNALIAKVRELLDIPLPSGGTSGLVSAVYNKLKAGESLGNVTELTKLAEQHFGSSRVSGNWTPKDMFDAMEAGVNKYLMERGKELMEMPVEKALAELKTFESRLTSQGTRTDEQIKAQQFSTPPRESFVVAKVAALKPSDVVLEPSAGNGGLAVWPEAIGAKVHVNEIADRRQQMLEAAGFDKPTAHDGELINALLDRSIQPTVVLMNPPFSSSAVEKGQAKNTNLLGFNHVDQALQRLAPNGRLVAILGGGQANQPEGGASLTTRPAADWFKKIAERYHIRANVRVNGKEYQKYGTNFATRIIVIDKDGPMTGDRWLKVVKKNVDTLEEAYNALSRIAESRPEVAPGELRRTGRAGQDESDRSLVPNPSDGVSGVREPARGSGGSHGQVSAPVGSDGAGSRAATPRPGGGDQQLPVSKSESQPARHPEGETPGSAGGSAAHGDRERQVAAGGLDLESIEAAAKREEEEEAGSAYVNYRPTLKGAAHPGAIVETKAMATVPMPPLTYKPSLPDAVMGKSPDYKDAKLSAVQLEAVAIAGMQNDITLPGGYRASALIGDGTGVGKGREGAAILWDNWRKGRKRLVWMTKSKDLISDAIRDLQALGADDLAKNIRSLGKITAADAIEHEGVLFTTYALFRSADKKGNQRSTQIDAWLRGSDAGDGGYLLMDESHLLKNAVVEHGAEASQIGEKVKGFLEGMPALRTVSLSATAATDVMNLGYLDRLGLWGPGTPFPGGFAQFAGEIAHGGMSAMEMIARELKSQGKYVARTLTFRGVKYSTLEHKINPDQEAVYNTACNAWQNIFASVEDTIAHSTGGGGRQKAMAMSAFFATQQRFFSLLLTSLKIPTVVEAAKKDLAEGRAVAITLINTNEAAQNREKNRVAAEESDEEPDYDFGPGRMLKDMVMEHYPTQQYETKFDGNGKPVQVPVYEKDKDGNDTNIPVRNPEAEKARDELLAKLDRELHMPNNPLDELIEQLGGHSKVAELTGRKQRFDPSSNRLVNRGGNGVTQEMVNRHEMAAFQKGDKLIAVLSSAADTGISLHSDAGAKNQRQRMVYGLQMGWSADKALQMMGRFNRSNQVNAPEYGLVRTDIGGEARFISSIARRMESLEALSKGQTKTNAGTDAMSKVNFETEQGRAATQAFYNQLLRNQEVPGTQDPKGAPVLDEGGKEIGKEPLRGMQVLEYLRVLKSEAGGGKTVPPADRTNVTRLLNRMLALQTHVQNPVYEYFFNVFGAVVERAIEAGELDTGVKRLHGDSFKVKEFREVAADPVTKAKTFYYPVAAQERVERMPVKKLDEMLDRADRQGKHPVMMKHREDGRLVLAVDSDPIVKADGSVLEAKHVFGPDSAVPVKITTAALRDWVPMDKGARDKVAAAQQDMERFHREAEYQQSRLDHAEKNNFTAQVQLAKEQIKQANAGLERARQARIAAKKEMKQQEFLPAARDEWQKQYESADTHRTRQHHLVGGAVMRFWNAIREAVGNNRLEVYSTVDADSGQRVVGIEIPGSKIGALIARMTGGKSTIGTAQIIPDVLQNGTQYELEGGITIRRGRVNRKEVVQFVTSNPHTQQELKDMGVLHERGAQPIYYLPAGHEGSEEYKRAANTLDKILDKHPPVGNEPKTAGENLAGESGTFTPSALNPKNVKKVYRDFIDRVIDQTLDLGDKYRRVGEHDPVIAKMLHEKDHAPRYFRDKAQSNVDQVTKGLSEPQIRLVAMMADSDAREYLEENHPEQFEEAEDDPAVMAAVNQFKQYQQELSALRINLGWHVRRDLSMVETESGEWEVIDRDGNPVETFKKARDAQEYVEDNGTVLDHLKRTYPEHLREPLMGRTDAGPNVSSGSYGGIRPPKPDKKQRLATGEYFYEHGAKDFSGYLQSFTQASHATLNKKIYDQLTEEAQPWQAGTAQPSDITYHGKTYYRPDVALSMRSGVGENKVAHPLEYRAYDPAKDDKLLIKSFEDGWGTMTTGKPGISIHDRWLAPKEVVEALDNYDTTRGALEHDSIRRFFQEQIVGLFGPTVHMLNIMRRLAHTVGTGAWDPRVWPYYQKLFFSPELRERMADGLADDTIDALSKYGTYTNSRDIGSLHSYFLGNMNPANWVRQTIGKFSKGLLFDPKFMGGFGGMDQKARVLAFDFLKEHEGMDEEEASKNVDDGFGNYNRASWTERMKRWARVLLFPGWDFSSLKWFLRHPFKTAVAPALVTLAANLAVNRAGKNKDQDKYDFGYLHYGDRKFRTSLFTEAMALHLAEPVLSAGRAALEGGNAQDVGSAAGEGVIRGAGGLASSLRPEIQMATELLSNRQYAGGTKEIWKPEDASLPGKVLPNRKLDKLAAFAAVKALPAINRFLDSSYDNVDMATGVGSVLGVTNYRSGAEERLRANVAKAKGYSETLAALAEHDPAAAEKYSLDPTKAVLLVFHGDLSQLSADLKQIDAEKEQVVLAPGIAKEARKQMLEQLAGARQQVLTSADALDDALTAAKLRMKGATQ